MNYKKIIVVLAIVVLVIGSVNVTYADSPFIDIENNWAKENIISVYEKGLMNGTSAQEFSPDKPVDKYSAIITIARMMDAEKKADLDALVEKHKSILDKYDVPSYARREVAFCHENDVILGEIDLVKFSDSPNATKLDITVYLGRAFGIEHDPSKPPVQLFFRDTENILRAYRIYVDHMIKVGVVNGTGDANGDFRPNDLVTRAMFAKMVDVASQEYVKEFDGTSDIIDNQDLDDKAPVVSTPIQDGDALEPSDEITDTIDYVSDIASSTTAKGIIDSIIYSRNSKPKVTLEIESQKMMTFYIPEDLIKENIIINGQLSDVYSLRPGMQVEVKAQNGEIKNIATVEITRSIDGKAIVKSIDLLNATIIVDVIDGQKEIVEEKKIDLKNAKIGDLSFNIFTMDELRLGQSITFFGIEDMEGIKASTIIVQ